MKCPGQDRGYWTADAVFEIPCPQCGVSIDVFKDDSTARCSHCGHRFPNPGAQIGCAEWCSLAKECRGIAPKQRHLQRATELAIAAVSTQSDDQLQWLGAKAAGSTWQLPVLNETLLVDLSTERVATQAGELQSPGTGPFFGSMAPDLGKIVARKYGPVPFALLATQAGQDVGPLWSILTLHYLATASRPERLPPEITFADLATARSYAKVYRQRAIARLCGTVGGDSARLTAAAMGLGGRAVAEGDVAFDFDVFPRLTLRLVWYAGDDELPPDATLLLPPNIESYFTVEDVVVLSERLASRLAGQSWMEK